MNKWRLFTLVWSLVVSGASASTGDEAATPLQVESKGKQLDPLVEKPLIKYAEAQLAELHRTATENEIEIAPEYNAFIKSIEVRDWAGSTNAFEKIFMRYRGLDDPEVVNALWPPTMELYGVVEQFLMWDSRLLDEYRNEVLNVIPPNAIYFGGTDPGRFVFNAYEEAVAEKSFYVITQNALADATYTAYEREDPRNDGMWLPGPEDLQRAFLAYKKMKTGSEEATGRIEVRGTRDVMMVNGLIARQIFEHNKNDHVFYVEESFAIEWMDPYLEPCGPIMRLNPEPVELGPDIVNRDMDYWKQYSARMLADKTFIANEYARKTISKFRTAQARLYTERAMSREAETAFRQALLFYNLGPESNVRLADLLAGQQRYDDAIALLDQAITNASAAHHPVEIFKSTREKIKRQHTDAEQPAP